MGNAWLRCRVSGGMFSNERIVIVRRTNKGPDQFFVPDSTVREETPGNGGMVQVRKVSDPWVELPTNHKDLIPVHKEDLVEG